MKKLSFLRMITLFSKIQRKFQELKTEKNPQKNRSIARIPRNLEL